MRMPEGLNYVRIRSDFLYSYAVQKIPDSEFMAEFEKAINLESSLLSEYVVPQIGRLPRSEWDALKKEVYKRDGEKCAYCGTIEPPFHIDHIHPLSRGGKNDLENLTVACAPCNQSKSDKTLQEWQS